MASDTTFLQATNSLLRSLNSASVVTADFADPSGAQNAREIRQCKEVILEVFRELQNKRPDSYWRKEADIFLAKTHLGSGDADASEGADVTNADPNVTLNDPDLATSSIADVVETDLYFHVVGENQWYRVLTLDTGTGALVLTTDYLGDTSTDNSYELVPYRFALPADFRDAINFFSPIVGVDVRPSSVERLIEWRSTNSVLISDSWPRDYAIGYDGAGARRIYIYPFLSNDVWMVLRYQKQQTVPSAAADTFDLEEDAMPVLLNRAKALAHLEITGNLQAVAYYRALEEEKRDDDATKQMERVGTNRLAPSTGMDYRKFYAEETDVDNTKRRIFLRR
jgi:hypothetical protein